MSPSGASVSLSASKETPVQGTLHFHQHNLPGLEAGAYLMDVAQTVDVNQQTEQHDSQYFFAVQAPRFALSPLDIFAVFPPHQAEGEFDNTFPHVVLTKQTLPWMRFPTVEDPPSTFPESAVDRDVPTWMAVLLVGESDVERFGFDPAPRSGTANELFHPSRPVDGAATYSYFYRSDFDDGGQRPSDADLTKRLGYGQSLNDSCQLIDLPVGLFNAIAPSVDDLMVTAHVRTVNLIRKATQNGTPVARTDLSNVPASGSFPLVFGNRVAKTGERSFAYLVSLEGLEPFLPSDQAKTDNPDEVKSPTDARWHDGTQARSLPIDRNGFLRLIVLKSWSFTSTGDGSHFTRHLEGLQPKWPPAFEPGGTKPTAYDFSIGIPVPESDAGDSDAMKNAKNAARMGYTAMRHATREGGATVSWYRGPLLPHRVEAATLPATLTSADAATRYDPKTGMFDVSYSAAWQLGRLLGLRDRRFAASLYNWRRNNLRGVVARMEALIVSSSLGQIERELRDDELILPLLKAFLPSDESMPAAGAPHNARSRHEVAAEVRATLTDDKKIAAHLDGQLEVPFEIYSWLARLKLLDGVPFHYLVPDEKMLPPESIRFFSVDMNWIHALIDGALSIGRQVTNENATPELSHDAAARQPTNDRADGNARNLRNELLGAPLPESDGKLNTVTGFILRSAVVAGWPGLEVEGYSKDGKLLDIVRFERLAPDVLLCLFEKDDMELHLLDIHEPPEGIHFGVTDVAPKSVRVRYNVSNDDQLPGDLADGGSVMQPAPFRSGVGDRVVRMFRLARALHDPKYGPFIDEIQPEFEHLPSSEFALQMLKGVGMVHFEFGRE